MNNNKRVIIAIALSALIMLAYMYYQSTIIQKSAIKQEFTNQDPAPHRPSAPIPENRYASGTHSNSGPKSNRVFYAAGNGCSRPSGPTGSSSKRSPSYTDSFSDRRSIANRWSSNPDTAPS